tara:strand:+ start:2674 stop:3351 length:678 start_codon:yes stop_codon:yes gene_type:complete
MAEDPPIPLKTRMLRRYEAEPTVFATEGGDPPMELFSPFGPMIGRYRLPQPLLDQLNTFADSQIKPATSSEFLVPDSIVYEGEKRSLGYLTAHWIARYLQAVDQIPVKGVNFENFWVVSQYAGTPSPVHFHSSDVSGVLYLKLPEVENEEEQDSLTYISGRQAGYINFITGGRQPFSKSVVSFKPAIGDFYLFPGWLLHGAEPFQGKGERRSLAFNATITFEEIA